MGNLHTIRCFLFARKVRCRGRGYWGAPPHPEHGGGNGRVKCDVADAQDDKWRVSLPVRVDCLCGVGEGLEEDRESGHAFAASEDVDDLGNLVAGSEYYGNPAKHRSSVKLVFILV